MSKEFCSLPSSLLQSLKLLLYIHEVDYNFLDLPVNAVAFCYIGTIESFMESKARKSFLGWLKLARVYCKEQLTLAAGIPYTEKEEEDVSEANGSDDEFFDFSEEDEKALSICSESRTLGVIYSQEGEDGLQNWLRHSVSRQLSSLHVTSDASRSHIKELNRRLQKMEEDILTVQDQLQDGFYVPYSVFWGLLGMGLATGVLFGAGHIILRSQRST